MLLQVKPVRRLRAFAASSPYETGDGEGSENGVPCDGANTLLLFVYVDEPDALVADWRIKVEFSAGDDEPHWDTTSRLTGGADQRGKEEFRLLASRVSGGEARFALRTPVLGRLAHVSASSAFTGLAPKCAVVAATATTLGGEGRVAGPHLVKTAGPPSSTGRGDGPGAEHPVPIHDASRLVLLLNGNLAASSRLDAFMELSLDGMHWYRETFLEGAPLVDVAFRTYQIAGAEFNATPNSDGALAVSIDALGAWARFTLATGAGTVNSVAAQAIVGRV